MVTSVVCLDEFVSVGVLTIQACNVAGIDGHFITPQHLHEHITAKRFPARADTLRDGMTAGAFFRLQYHLCC